MNIIITTLSIIGVLCSFATIMCSIGAISEFSSGVEDSSFAKWFRRFGLITVVIFVVVAILGLINN